MQGTALRGAVDAPGPHPFIPALDGWSDRRECIARESQSDFFHSDFRGQALAKIERGHVQDLSDVREFVARGLVTLEQLRAGFAEIEPRLVRYPALDAAAFARKLRAFLGEP